MTRHGRTARARPHGERGSLSVQLVVIMPVLFTIAFAGMQAGLYFYGRSAALSAATTGAQGRRRRRRHPRRLRTGRGGVHRQPG